MKIKRIDRNTHKRLLQQVEIDPSKYKGILCPLRGGMYVADPLSRKYNLPMYYIHMRSYENKEQKDIVLLNKDYLKEGHYLIVDDIYDTGKTVDFIKKEYFDCTFDVYCLVNKQKDVGIMYSMLVEEDVWVEYFWENLL